MSHANRINTPPPKIDAPRSPHEHDSPRLRGNSHHTTPPPGHLKHNAAPLFNHDWQNSRANNLRNTLITLLSGSEQGNPSHGAQPGNHSQTAQQSSYPQSVNYHHSHGETHNHSHVAQSGHQQSFVLTAANAANYAAQTLQSLINLAKEHVDFRHFQNRAENFWQSVGRMSEVKILQSETGELQLVSRYAELLDKFNNRGGRLEAFLLSLPAHEREVFAARYQMEKTFGAGHLFIGNGIMPDKNGNFALRQFLINNGKSVDLPLNFAASLRESGLLAAGDSLLVNRQALFNAESAAMLGVSLAFYQNLAASVNLKDAVIYTLLQNFLVSAKETLPARLPVNLLAGETAPRKPETSFSKPNESVIVGALINGTLSAAEKRARFFDAINLEARTRGGAANRLGFSAGATGAMLGAAIGCLVPLAGTAAGRATGLATSIVIGTEERGLRSLNISLLISDVVTNAVQTLLDALPDNLLADPAKAHLTAASTVEDWRASFLNRRMNAYLGA